MASVDRRRAVNEKPAGMPKSEPHATLVRSVITAQSLGWKDPVSRNHLTASPVAQSSLSGKSPTGLTMKTLTSQTAAMISMSRMATLLGIGCGLLDSVGICVAL